MLIFVLQAIWLYIKELAGKDLDVVTVIKFLFYITPTLIPLIFPLTILLSSIMVFGNFAENYEFAAMKSTGISLQRAMASLKVFIIGLGLLTFFFSNNIIPWAEYNSYNLRKNIAKVKPAMAIAEGQFTPIGDGFNIKVGEKSGKNGKDLKDIIIHQKSGKTPLYYTTIIAKTGVLGSDEKDADVLKLILYDGYYYDDTPPSDRSKLKRKLFTKSYFKKYTKNIDLAEINKIDVDKKEVNNRYSMLDIIALNYTVDSLKKSKVNTYSEFSKTLYKRTNLPNLNKSVNTVKDTLVHKGGVLDLFKLKNKIKIIDYALNSIKSTHQIINSKEKSIKYRNKIFNLHIIALHEKFALAFACVILFFVGAPLGALIRKGGMGLPMVIAIVLFLTYHFLGIFAKNSAKNGTIDPVFSAWFSTLIMLPLSIYLTSRATKDRGLLEIDGLLEPLKKLFRIKSKTTELSTKMFNTFSKEYKALEKYDNDKLIKIIKDYTAFDYTLQHKNTAISILTSRGITKQELKMAGHLNNDFIEEANNLKNHYSEDSKLAFILYSIGAILILGGRILINNKFSSYGNILFIIGIIIFLIFIIALAKSFSKHSTLYKHLGKNNSINGILFSVIGLPLYFIFYFIQKKQIKKDLKNKEIGSIKNVNKKEHHKLLETPKTEQDSFKKIAIIMIIASAVLFVLHFVFANNKLMHFASPSIQLSPILLIVSIFYYIKSKL